MNREAELRQSEEQLERLLKLKIDNLITDNEFKSQRLRLRERLAELESTPHDVDSGYESVLSDLESLRPTLCDLLGHWSSLQIENRKRFQFLMLPSGYVVGRVGTAQRGRLFSLIGPKPTSDTNLVHLTGNTWNQLIEEITVFAEIFREHSDKSLRRAA